MEKIYYYLAKETYNDRITNNKAYSNERYSLIGESSTNKDVFVLYNYARDNLIIMENKENLYNFFEPIK